MSVILNPVEQYFDLEGEPLQNGYLYFGEVYGNPVTQPVMVYFDPEFTLPAAQPVRTVNGYPVRNGTATGIYAPVDVSILVQNKNREQVIYIESSAIDTGDTTTIYRESDTSLNSDDNNRTFILLNPIVQTFDPSVNLGDRWRVNIINMSSGNVTLDPNLSETIDGKSSLILQPNQIATVYCDGVNLKSTTNIYPSTTIASAATLDLRAVKPKVITVSGTNTISTIQMIDGDRFTAIASGAFTLVNSASLSVQGNTNYTATVGDVFTFTKDATASNVYVTIQKKNGDNVLSGIYSVTADVTMTAQQWGGLFVNTSSSNWTVTLDSVTNNANRSVQFRASGSGNLTIARSGSSTFTVRGTTGLTSIYLTKGQFAEFVCDGTNFLVTIIGDGQVEVSTTSGSTVSIPNMPAWATQFDMVFNDISESAGDSFIVRMGDSGGFIATGYVMTVSNVATTVSTSTSTTGILILNSSASGTSNGIITITRLQSSLKYIFSGSIATLSSTSILNGNKSMPGVIESFQLLLTGVGSYDGGSVLVRWR